MMTVIADATPLIYLAAIGKFDLLGVLYGRIVIPCTVYDEVVIQGAGRPEIPLGESVTGVTGFCTINYGRDAFCVIHGGSCRTRGHLAMWVVVDM